MTRLIAAVFITAVLVVSSARPWVCVKSVAFATVPINVRRDVASLHIRRQSRAGNLLGQGPLAFEQTVVPVSLTGLPAGYYTLNIYRVGYGVNDVYTDYFKMGSPQTLTREQVRLLADRNSGRPISIERVRVGRSGEFAYSFAMRENMFTC